MTMLLRAGILQLPGGWQHHSEAQLTSVGKKKVAWNGPTPGCGEPGGHAARKANPACECGWCRSSRGGSRRTTPVLPQVQLEDLICPRPAVLADFKDPASRLWSCGVRSTNFEVMGEVSMSPKRRVNLNATARRWHSPCGLPCYEGKHHHEAQDGLRLSVRAYSQSLAGTILANMILKAKSRLCLLDGAFCR